MMTIKTGLLIVAILAVMSVMQVPPPSDLIFIFIAGGVVPGTNLVVPPEIILVTTAMALMMVFGLLIHLYTEHQAAMRSLVSRYKVKRQDPSYIALVPGLGKVLTVSGTIAKYAKNAPQQMYFWLKYLGHPARVQAVATRVLVWAGHAIASARFWLSEEAHLQHKLLHAVAMLRKWSIRARAYLMRVTTF